MENKIILIEDDEEIRSMVKDYLSGEFQVLPFSEGKTAIHTVKNYDEYSLALISVLDQEFIRIYDSNISGKVLSKALIESGVGLESLGRKQDTLEDYFFQLTEEGK